LNDQLRKRAVGAPAARSILLTILGEYVLPSQRSVWLETMIQALGVLDYQTHAARQAIARSVTGGWLRSERTGRRARLSLTPETREMLEAGAGRIYSFGAPWDWEGRWLLVVLRVPEERRDVRHQMRTQLAWAGFGSLGGGLWISPHVERERELSHVDPAAELLSFDAAVGGLGDPARVLTEAWDLASIADAYRGFVDRFRSLRPNTPEAVFRAQTQLVHGWRKFPFLDPDLPESVLPAKWPRAQAHDVFHERHASWHEIAQDYFLSLEALRDAA
jgi:phenylacetic acid degradation operon negative regulatory protein